MECSELGREFCKAGRCGREIVGVEPVRADAESGDRLAGDPALGGFAGDEVVVFAEKKLMTLGWGRIENPIFLDAVLFVRGKLRTEVAVGGAGGEDFANPSRRDGCVGRSQVRKLRVGEPSEVGFEDVALGKPNGNDLLE